MIIHVQANSPAAHGEMPGAVQQSTVYSPPPAQCNASIPVLGCSRDFFATTDPASAAWGLAPFFTLPLALALRPSAPSWPGLAWPFPFVLVREQGARPSPFAFSRPTHSIYRLPFSTPQSIARPPPSILLLLLVLLLRYPAPTRTSFACAHAFADPLFFLLSSFASFLCIPSWRAFCFYNIVAPLNWNNHDPLSPIVALVNQTGLAGTLTSRGISRRTACTTLLTPTTKSSRSQFLCQSNSTNPFAYGDSKEFNRLRARVGRHGVR